MPFNAILHDLLTATPGSIAALFLDYEGETVEMVSEHDLEPDDIRIVGAYQGIFLTQLRALCSHMDVGQPKRFKLGFRKTWVLSCDLKEGYYLVLLVDAAAGEGAAWHHLDRCRERLLREM
jgi:hypothetical protein